MGNFNNVSMGTGSLEWDGVDIGYLKGDVNYSYNYEIEDFKTGVPLMLRGSICKEIVSELKAPIAEINAANIAMVLGGLTVTTVAAAEVDVSTMVVKTFAPYPNATSTLEAIQLMPNLSGTAKKPVITTLADGATVEGTDWFCDYVEGIIYLNPESIVISSGDSVKVTSYSYTPAANKTVKLGTQFSLEQKSLQFTHISPVTGKIKRVYMPLAQADGKVEIPFAETSFMVINVTFKAIYDAASPTYPMGYYYEET
jgi:hypothetical protein